jgi:hypothetical protein
MRQAFMAKGLLLVASTHWTLVLLPYKLKPMANTEALMTPSVSGLLRLQEGMLSLGSRSGVHP